MVSCSVTHSSNTGPFVRSGTYNLSSILVLHQLLDLKQLPNVETHSPYPQALLSLEFHCRMNVSAET